MLGRKKEMEWYNILAIVLGALGGVSGIVSGIISLYKAKPEKSMIEVGNLRSRLDEADTLYDEMNEEKKSVTQEFRTYKEENMRYIAEFKGRFELVERRLDKTENEVLRLRGAIYQGYRCKYPANVEDCPVIKEYERKHCLDCDACEDK